MIPVLPPAYLLGVHDTRQKTWRARFLLWVKTVTTVAVVENWKFGASTAFIKRYMFVSAYRYVRPWSASGGSRRGLPTLRFLRTDPIVLVIVLAFVAAGTDGACGNVTFVDAPFAPRKIDVMYSSQEDVTAVRWRLSATEIDDAVRFELLDAAGVWQPIDFTSSVYRGGVVRCGKGAGLCAQMVLPGRYRPPADSPTPLRSRNPTYDLSPGDAPSFHDYAQTLTLKAFFSRDNGGLVTTIGDIIGADATFVFPRPLEHATWERRGVCIPGYAPDDAQFGPVAGLKDPWPAPTPLSATGLYCASVRPITTGGDRGIDVQLAIDTVPQVVSGDHLYTVPTEVSPFHYQIVLDLSIPVADRCQDAIQEIQALVAQRLGKVSPVNALPLVDLSTGIDPETHAPAVPCRQSPDRSIDATAMAQAVKTAAAGWPELHPRYFLLYFNNLRAPVPDLLGGSLSSFTETLLSNPPPPPAEFQAQLWPFGPMEMLSSFGGWGTTSTTWASATDADFVVQLDDYAHTNLPLISEIQDVNLPVPMLPDDGTAARLDGGWLRLCQISIAPVQGSGLQMTAHDSLGHVAYLAPASEYMIHQADPPAYLLQVPPVWAVPSAGFKPHQAHIRYEVCTRYCDHAFTSESGVAVSTGWIGNPLCVGPPDGEKG
jgi:hypothetical protein